MQEDHSVSKREVIHFLDILDKTLTKITYKSFVSSQNKPHLIKVSRVKRGIRENIHDLGESFKIFFTG